MKKSRVERLDNQYRFPAEIVNPRFADINPEYLEAETSRNWWDLISSITLIVTREHEHFACTLSGNNGVPHSSCFPIPHPNGLAIANNKLLIASTRNPNAIYEFLSENGRYTLQSIHFYPGNMRLHELYWDSARQTLLANATGYDSVVAVNGQTFDTIWNLSETDDVRKRAHVNSIGQDPKCDDTLYFSSFLESPVIWEQHKELNKSGVIFDNRGNVVARGLTAPHSVRCYRNRMFVCDSGYGLFGEIDRHGVFQPIAKLNGWTRGVCFYDNYAFVGVSKVILEKARQYAPGFDKPEDTECAIWAIDIVSGTLEGYIRWQDGGHIFDICSTTFSTFSHDWNRHS